MNAPDKIYLHGYSFSEEPVKSWEREPKVKRGVTGFKPQYAEYIRKDALLEWLDGKMTIEEATEGFVGGYDSALKDVIEHINKM